VLSTVTWDVVRTATIVLGGLLFLKFSSIIFTRIRKRILKDPEPMVVVKEFGDSSLLVELRVWIENAKERRIIQDEINKKIKIECEKSAIEMPYPAQDIYIKEHPSPPLIRTICDWTIFVEFSVNSVIETFLKPTRH
jgi:small-conductance mechanosensitive channel